MSNSQTKRKPEPGRGGRIMARYVRFVLATSRLQIDPPDMHDRLAASKPVILAMWHGQFMLLPGLNLGDLSACAMVARHADTRVLAGTLEAFGIRVVYGAGSGRRDRDRGGATALREALRALRGGESVAMTAEIPPGPPRQVTMGIITLARMSGRPIMPLVSASSRYHALDTWSRMTINLPFSKIVQTTGEPVWVPRDADEAEMERCRQLVEERLNEATGRAYALAGADPYNSLPPNLTEPPAPGLHLRGYRLVTSLLRPLAPAILRYRARRGKEETARTGERLGVASRPRPSGQLIWFHAASVGEANTVLPVIAALHVRQPQLNVLMTTGTVTSAELVRDRLDERTVHQYVPLDSPHFVGRFLDHWQPDMAVLAESEVWPNLVLATTARRIPIALINGRLSGKSFRSWRRTLRSARALFGHINLVLAQTEAIADRFRRLGARNVRTVGNIKMDAPAPPVDDLELARLRSVIGGRQVVLAASTHRGEDTAVLQAHRALKADLDSLLTIIAPRHPERGPAIADEVAGTGLGVALRSRGELPGPEVDVYVADTIGELGLFYMLAPLALIGGSLIAHGGQNPVEAIKRGCAVLTGPHTRNFREVYKALGKTGGCREVTNAGELAATIATLLGDHALLETIRMRADEAIEGLSGALGRTTDALAAELRDAEELRRAS